MAQTLIENPDVVHAARSGKMSETFLVQASPGRRHVRAALSFWFLPAPEVALANDKRYFNVVSLRALPGWEGRVMAFLRRERRGFRLQANWGAASFVRSRHVPLASLEDLVGVEIFVEPGLVTAHLYLDEGVEELVVELPDTPPLELDAQLEVRLGNPDLPGQPGETDRDPGSMPEPGAVWSFARLELLEPGAEPRGLMAPGDDGPPQEIAAALLLLTSGALGGALSGGKTPAAAAAAAVEAAQAAYELLGGR